MSIEPNFSRPKIRLSGAEAIVRVLKTAGIREAYGLASGKLGPLFKALGAEPSIAYVGVRQEAAASFMATGVFAGSGRIALCLGETGPGGLNLLSGLGGASANHLAVLAITSSNPGGLLAPIRGGFSSTDNHALFAPLMKASLTAREVRRIPELLRHLLRVALTGAPGPVHLDIAADLLAGGWDFDEAELDAPIWSFVPSRATVPAPDLISHAAGLLGSARRPLLIAGGGLVSSGGVEAFHALAEHLGAPAMTTPMGLGAVRSDHPRFIGHGGLMAGPAAARALREADVILAVGCRFSSWMWFDGPPAWNANPGQSVIQIDINPEAIGRNLPVAIGLVGDANATTTALLDALESTIPCTDLNWTLALTDAQHAHRAVLDAMADRNDEVIHPAALARTLGQFIGGEGLAVFDGGHTSFWSNDFTPALAPRTRLHEPGMSHLGFGLPWAMALKHIHRDQNVFCITGDGAFGFTVGELDSARRYGLNVITVIHNNASFGVIRLSQNKSGFEFGTGLEDTDYAAIARGFGCFGERVEVLEDLIPALNRALESGLPAVIDVRVAFHPHPSMPVFGKSTSAP